MAKFRKNAKFFTRLTKEVMTISKVEPIWITGGPNPGEERSTPFKK